MKREKGVWRRLLGKKKVVFFVEIEASEFLFGRNSGVNAGIEK